jgi:hypothetical protein
MENSNWIAYPSVEIDSKLQQQVRQALMFSCNE